MVVHHQRKSPSLFDNIKGGWTRMTRPSKELVYGSRVAETVIDREKKLREAKRKLEWYKEGPGEGGREGLL